MPSAAELPRAASFAQLREDLVRRFPGVVAPPPSAARGPLLRNDAPFAWVECALGEGGVAWLAAWTLLRLADDALGRPALWVDTHGTLTPGDLLDLSGKLVVVRPDDPHEAHIAADIALRSGSFSLVALEMHRALHPKPLARLARIAHAAALSRGGESVARTPVVLWGEPPAFVAPPSGVPRTAFSSAVHALFEALAAHGTPAPTPSPSLTPSRMQGAPHDDALPSDWRRPHTTDRLRPLDRAADRRPSPSRPDDDARRARAGELDVARGGLLPPARR